MRKTRQQVLNEVIEYKYSWAALSKELDELEASSDGVAVRILPRHIAAVLNRYAAGELDALEVEEWANMIEMRDEIEYSPEHEQLLRELIWELANPQLSQKLTNDRAQELMKALPQ
jgi:hypothetical protein